MIVAPVTLNEISIPVMYEDEGQEHMGESRPHNTTVSILYYGLMAHFEGRPPATVLQNMNLYYHPVTRRAYCSPDVMVVPVGDLKSTLKSYRIGKTGPAPILTVEVLSQRTFQQGDFTRKPEIYSKTGIAEYLLADVTGKYLSERLLLKTRDTQGRWTDDYDDGHGIVSMFGFRVRIESDQQVRVYDAETGEPYLRPEEAREQQVELKMLQSSPCIITP